MSQRWAVVDENGETVNLIIAEADFEPGEGLRLVPENEAKPFLQLLPFQIVDGADKPR